MGKNIDSNENKSWLNKLMLDSWEIEMLFSGFAVFGLFELEKYLDNYLYLNTGGEFFLHSESTLAEGLYNVLLVIPILFHLGVTIFIINLLIYLFFRGLWIGAVGLRYVSGDIEYDKLNFSPRFRRFFESSTGTYDDFILRLEKISSIIFALTFLMVFVIVSFLVYLILTFFLIVIIAKFSWKLSIVFGILSLITFVVFILDFFTLSYLKKIKNPIFRKGYYWLYRIISLATLSWFWRPMLLNFLEEKFAKRAILLIIPYLFIFVFIDFFESNKYGYFPSMHNYKTPLSSEMYVPKYYDNLNLEYNTLFDVNSDYITHFSIPKHKFKGRLFEIFIPHDDCFEFILSNKNEKSYFNKKGLFLDIFSENKIKKKQAIALADSIKNQLFKTHLLSINNKGIDKQRMVCDFYVHPMTNQEGYLCFFPIDSLDVGRHQLGFEQRCLSDTLQIKIPFVYLGE